jgi:prepilin-type N-terminal cleavage/methylation domain-containing protein
MKRSLSKDTEAFTLVELLVALGVIALLAALVLPQSSSDKQKSRRIHCAINLKELGLAYRTWTIDGERESSPRVSTNQVGADKPITSGEAFRYF